MRKLLATVLLSGLMPLAASAAPPNIVVILSDDAGIEEFGLHKVKKGVPSNTPNINKLGERAVAFAHCWGQAICGPSRSMFLAGNYAVHKIGGLRKVQNGGREEQQPKE